MENGINKKGFFDLKVEPHLKPISDLGIGFYNLDENTATLRFQLSNSTGLLLISENNLSVYGYFESSNGSVSDVIELKITDELNGIAEITLDKEFLHASTSTKVTGQLYIGVNNVDNKPEYNEVAVLGEFTFEVADALINKVSSFTKIEYIRMFSQLKAKIEQDVVDIQEAIKNGADYVAEMQTVKEQGISQINQTVTEGKAYIDSVIAQAQTNINDTATNAIGDVNTAKDNALSTMNNTVSEKVSEVESVSNDVIKHVDDKLNEFNLGIEENSFIQPTDLDNKLNELTWQKFKITERDGTTPLMSDFDFNSPEAVLNYSAGTYYVRGALNSTANNIASNYGYLSINTTYSTKSVATLTFIPIGTNTLNNTSIYMRKKNGDWGDWKEITNNQYDTGWVTFDLINGAESNTEFKGETSKGFDCAYRVVTNGNVKTKTIRLNGRKLTQGQVVAQLPSDLFEYSHSFPIRVPTSTSYSGGYITARNTGEVRFYINGDSTNWNGTTGYMYGEYSWVE